MNSDYPSGKRWSDYQKSKTINHRDTETQRKAKPEKGKTLAFVFDFLCVSVVNGFFHRPTTLQTLMDCPQ